MKNGGAIWAVVLSLICVGSRAALGAEKGRFSVSPEAGFVIKLAGRPVAIPRDPKAYPHADIRKEASGFSVTGEGLRKEYAVFDDRLEFTFDFTLPAPAEQALTILLPLSDGATARVTHGRTHPAPPAELVYRAGQPGDGQALQFDGIGPAPAGVSGANAVFPLRYVTVKAPDGALSVDVQPAGANSEDPSYAESPLRIFACRQTPEGAEIVARIPRGYFQYGGHLKGKIIFYADGRPFESVHPFAFANEYSGFERYVAVDFSNRPQARKSDPDVFGATPYDGRRKYGWLSDVSALTVVSTSLNALVHGTYIVSASPGKFRIDAPPGYYYLTLNIGNADGGTGPFRVRVNGEERLKRVALDKGRFRNEVLLVKTAAPYIELELEGYEGAPWLLNGLVLQPLGTLNEDFVFTRPWWNFEGRAAQRRP